MRTPRVDLDPPVFLHSCDESEFKSHIVTNKTKLEAEVLLCEVQKRFELRTSPFAFLIIYLHAWERVQGVTGCSNPSYLLFIYQFSFLFSLWFCQTVSTDPLRLLGYSRLSGSLTSLFHLLLGFPFLLTLSHSFLAFRRCLPSTYYVSGTVPGAGNKGLNHGPH